MPVVMDADRVGKTLTRIAHEILERNRTLDEIALVGIRSRGEHLARRLAEQLEAIAGQPVPTGALDITLYRDDLMRQPVGPQPLVRRTEIPFSIDDRVILLVDDVLVDPEHHALQFLHFVVAASGGQHADGQTCIDARILDHGELDLRRLDAGDRFILAAPAAG